LGTCKNECPAFGGWQLDDAVNVRGVDKVGFPEKTVNEFAVLPPLGSKWNTSSTQPPSRISVSKL
jgi:hypothetical protein